MKKKNLISIFLILVLSLSMVACGSKNDKNNVHNNISTESQNQEGSESTQGTENQESESTGTDNVVGEIVGDENVLDESENLDGESHIHSYKTEVIKPTCEKEGYTLQKCSCGDEKKTDVKKALEHKYGAWKTKEPATETAVGKAERKCELCGDTENKELSKLPAGHKHSYNKTIVKPTCTTTGYTVHTCSCGDSYISNETAKKAHSYTKDVTKPTCTTKGYTTYSCSCGDSYISDYTNMSAHKYVDNKVAATCTSEGYTKHTCSVCGSSYTDGKVSKTNHSYSVTSDTATCGAAGTKTETCGVCGHTKTSNSPQLPHGATKTEEKAPSCTVNGYVRTVCKSCGTVISETIKPANGSHSWVAKDLKTAALEANEAGMGDWMKYLSVTDYNVNCCSTCKVVDMSTIESKYSNYEAAEIMLGYVNDLRRDVYGSNAYDLVLDTTLIELANIRAKEISVNFSHYGGTYTNASENIAAVKTSIKSHFDAWFNSPGHYNNMIYQDYKFFGYGRYIKEDNLSKGYGVQLFWSNIAREIYISNQ